MAMSAKDKATAILELRSEGYSDAQIIVEYPDYHQGFKWLLENPDVNPDDAKLKAEKPRGARGSGCASTGPAMPAVVDRTVALPIVRR